MGQANATPQSDLEKTLIDGSPKDAIRKRTDTKDAIRKRTDTFTDASTGPWSQAGSQAGYVKRTAGADINLASPETAPEWRRRLPSDEVLVGVQVVKTPKPGEKVTVTLNYVVLSNAAKMSGLEGKANADRLGVRGEIDKVDLNDGTVKFLGCTWWVSIAALQGYEEYQAFPRRTCSPLAACSKGMQRVPGLLIGLVMNIMLCVPFGLAFFPTAWEPFPAPRAIGLQMFLFSTFISQVVMTLGSKFDCAMGMMMVENIPFMHNIAQTIVDAQGTGLDALASTMTAFALSTLLVGGAFWFLGRYKLGRIVNYFPRHFIIGCIGGIGVFVVQTGFEVSTGGSWLWNEASLIAWSQPHMVKLWLVPVLLVVILNVLMLCVRFSLLPPVYFISIIPGFYAVTFYLGVSGAEARAEDWLFTRPPETDFWALWSYFDFSLVRWDVIATTMPTMFALTCFGLMHAPINVPSLSMSTNIDADMNQELVAHGVSNLISGVFGGLPNYLCYSNSLLYYKCNGGGRVSGLLLSVFLAVAFAMGPSLISYVPRCMAGCLLIHVGLDLCRESLIDPLKVFDRYEYVCVWLITATMTICGMTTGLGFGIVLSAISFTLQQMSFSDPIRGTMKATTLRSTKARRPDEENILMDGLRGVTVVQLQGTLFFGNATDLLSRCQQMLQEENATHTLILDFTLVRSLESSAAEAISKIYSVARGAGVKLVYNRGSKDGFPTFAPLSSQLMEIQSERGAFGPMVYMADDLDDAIAWAEDQLLDAAPEDLSPRSPSSVHKLALPIRQLQRLSPGESMAVITKLLQWMQQRNLKAGEVLWRQGDLSDCCLLLEAGLLQSTLEEEAGTVEDCHPGCLVGEYTFIKQKRRMSTVTVKEASIIHVLTSASWKKMLDEEAYLAFVVASISVEYLGGRCHNVMNRIWDTRCLSI